MSEAKKINRPTLNIEAAVKRLKSVVTHTPLQFNANLSRKYGCNVYFKREDLQIVRSYKLRGAYNMMSQLSKEGVKALNDAVHKLMIPIIGN